jgi:hypothetical protein
MSDAHIIVLPSGPKYIKTKTWFENKEKYKIQILDTNKKPVAAHQEVTFFCINTKEIPRFVKKDEKSPSSNGVRLKTDENGCVELPYLMAETAGDMLIIIEFGKTSTIFRISVLDILAPKLTQVNTQEIEGIGEPNTEILLSKTTTLKEEEDALSSFKLDNNGKFLMTGNDATYGTDCCFYLVHREKNITSDPIHLRDLLIIPPFKNVQKVTQGNQTKLIGYGRITGKALAEPSEEKASSGNYKNTFNQVFVEVGSYENTPPSDAMWSAPMSFDRPHPSGDSILIPIEESSNGFWCIDLPDHLAKKEKLYVRQALNKRTDNIGVIVASSSETIGTFRVTKQPQNQTVRVSDTWELSIEAEKYQQIQWQFLENNQWINWSKPNNQGNKKQISFFANKEGETQFRAKFTFDNQQVYYSNTAKVTVKNPLGTDISNKFNVPKIKFIKTPSNVIEVIPAEENIEQRVFKEPKRSFPFYGLFSRNRPTPKDWFVYETTSNGKKLIARFSENDSVQVVCERLNELNLNASNSIEMTTQEDALITRIFESNLFEIHHDFGVLVAKKGNEKSSHQLKANTEYYIYLDHVLVDHFNTNSKINQENKEPETTEKVIERINKNKFKSSLRFEIKEKTDKDHDVSTQLSTSKIEKETGNLYIQNINGYLQAKAINPNEIFTIKAPLNFYEKDKLVFTLKSETKKTTREVAKIFNELRMKTHLTDLVPFKNLADRIKQFEQHEDVKQLFTFNEKMKEGFDQLKEKIASSTQENEQQKMVHLMLIIMHEASLVRIKGITTKQAYDHHIDTHGRALHLVIAAVLVVFAISTYTIYAMFYPETEHRIGIPHNNRAIPPLNPVLPPALPQAIPMGFAAEAPAAQAATTTRRSVDLTGYLNQFTHIPERTTWNDFQARLGTTVINQMNLLDQQLEYDFVADHLNPNDALLNRLITEVSLQLTNWFEEQRQAESIGGLDRATQEIVQQRRTQLEYYQDVFSSLRDLRRALRRTMFLVVRNRENQRVVGLIRTDVLGLDLIPNYVTTAPHQTTGGNRIDNLGTYLIYLMIRLLKQSTDTIRLNPTLDNPQDYQISTLRIRIKTITEPSARIALKLGFKREDL